MPIYTKPCERAGCTGLVIVHQPAELKRRRACGSACGRIMHHQHRRPDFLAAKADPSTIIEAIDRLLGRVFTPCPFCHSTREMSGDPRYAVCLSPPCIYARALERQARDVKRLVLVQPTRGVA